MPTETSTVWPPTPSMGWVSCKSPLRSQTGAVEASKEKVTWPEGASAKQIESDNRKRATKDRRRLIGLIIKYFSERKVWRQHGWASGFCQAIGEKRHCTAGARAI